MTTPSSKDQRDEPQPRHHDEQGEQWRHGEPREQALISRASRQPGGVQRCTELDPNDQVQ